VRLTYELSDCCYAGMNLGAKLPNTGPAAGSGSAAQPVTQRARELEAAGFDSLWVSDHVVLPAEITSWYPFAADGRATWPSDSPWLETIVVLAAAAASTERVRLGTAVLVIPQRNPILLAKQLASIAQVAGGRLEVGVGAGWLREEFEALDAPFTGRGARMLEWIELMRSCWTGRPAPFEGRHYHLPADVLAFPTPPAVIPIYIGGHSERALRRAGEVADGWLGQQAATAFDPATLTREVTTVRAAATAAGRDPGELRIVLRIVESAGRADVVAGALGELAEAGVNEIIVDVDPGEGGAAADHTVLRAAAEAA
jgi:probable F420-dependent oxidoreductase